MSATCWWTQEQVKALQKRLGVAQTSILNLPTWKALEAILGMVEIEPEPKPEPEPVGNPYFVKNHVLYKGDSPVAFKRTPNVSAGKLLPRLIIIHYTGSNSFQGGLSWLTNSTSQVSCHLIITKEGIVWQISELNDITWHAGLSEYNDKFYDKNVNDVSIGIELVGTGDSFPNAQINALNQVIAALKKAYPTIVDIEGHDEVAPGRKPDPGPNFPWDKVEPGVDD